MQSIGKKREEASSGQTSGPNTCIKVTNHRHSQYRYSGSKNHEFDDQNDSQDYDCDYS